MPFVVLFVLRYTVILSVFLTLSYKLEVWLAIKRGSSHHFFFKCPASSQEYGSCYREVRLYV